ncbi:MAG TPA: hypothetical protein VEF76_08770 [Patescibacteria group bacterium]|nr:hypothetical protein [Patescibacteria group bacterium]
MTQKTAIVRADNSASLRITASRLSSRNASILLKRISCVPEQTDVLLAKEIDCCSRATD